MAKPSVRAKREAERDEIVLHLNSLKDRLTELAGEIRDAFDNLPEGLQQSEQGQIKEQAADALESAESDLDDVIADLEGMGILAMSNMFGGNAELTPCLTSAQVASYIDQHISQAERNRAEAHLATCQHCVKIVADVVRLVKDVSHGTSGR